MTLGVATALFATMLVLALIPSISAMTVAVRSATCGFSHGLFTSLGIVVGDIVFIVIAINGLALLADLLGGRFHLVRLLGGGYLIWLGTMLWRANSSIVGTPVNADGSLVSSFLAGLFITLGDQKAILFYFGFFPAFVDVSAVTPIDTAIIVLIAAVAVGGAKAAYAFMAHRAAVLLKKSSLHRSLNTVAGIILVVVGLAVVVGS